MLCSHVHSLVHVQNVFIIVNQNVKVQMHSQLLMTTCVKKCMKETDEGAAPSSINARVVVQLKVIRSEPQLSKELLIHVLINLFVWASSTPASYQNGNSQHSKCRQNLSQKAFVGQVHLGISLALKTN